MKSKSKIIMLAPTVLALGAIVGCNKNITVTEEQWKEAINYITGGYGDERNFNVIKKFKEKDSDVEFINNTFRVKNSLYKYEGFTNVGTLDEPKIIYYQEHSFQNEFGTISYGEDMKPWYINDGEKNLNALQCKTLDEIYAVKDKFNDFKFNSSTNSYKRDLPETLTSDKFVYDVKFNSNRKIETINYALLNEYQHKIYFTDNITYGNAKDISVPENKKIINATLKSAEGNKLTTDAITLESGVDYIFTFDLSLLQTQEITKAKFCAIDSNGNPIDKVLTGWFDLYKNGTKLKAYDGQSAEYDYTIDANWETDPKGIKSATFKTIPSPNDKLVFNFYNNVITDAGIKLCVDIS